MGKRILFFCVKMQTVFTIFIGIVLLVFIAFVFTKLIAYSPTIKAFFHMSSAVTEERGKLAIVIDDFGLARGGVKEMLAIDAPITAAVMPLLEYSEKDAKDAIANGKEVIIHIPLQSQRVDNPKWVGPHVIKIDYTDEKIIELMQSFITSMPEAVGGNIHMGSISSANERVMTAVMSQLKGSNLYFMDSMTNPKTCCKQVAETLQIPFAQNKVFLEQGSKSKATVRKQLLKAAKLAKEKGEAITIGHVGGEGGVNTAAAIAECLSEIDAMGVDIVFLSELVK